MIWLSVGLLVGFAIGIVVAVILPYQKPGREILVKAVVQDFFGSANPGSVLEHLDDAAWESRMDDGCHSPRSEVLTIWAKHLRAILPHQEAP